MPALETIELELGFVAPDFNLPDTVSEEKLSLEELKGEVATVVMFICNHCPYVVHVNPELVRLAGEYIPLGVSFIAINSNDVEKYPADSPENMRQRALELKYPFPYLFDETQQTAKDYHAVCTPDFSIFDHNLTCVYRGRLDGSRPGNNIPLTGEDIRKVLNALLNGTKIEEKQYPSIGCSIKWKSESPY
ncbi:MAG: thioredoxin family protein [Sphingobacteriales bacterium]|nr:MAG: thioredoxin family protein [Sphingobacteriales bacterium]